MFDQELQLKSRMSRVTSYDQLRLAKLNFLPDTDFQILVRTFLPFATIVSLAIFIFGWGTTLLSLDHVQLKSSNLHAVQRSYQLCMKYILTLFLLHRNGLVTRPRQFSPTVDRFQVLQGE